MMKILSVKLRNLRNEEHFQFQTEFKGLVEKSTPETLDIVPAWAVYQPLYENEAEALDVIRKSSLTENIANADHYRDSVYSGLRDTVKGAANHFNAAKKEAAARVQVVLDHYGNINIKTYDEQTAAINDLIAELNATYTADVATLAIGDWVTELQTANNSFETLMQERYSQDAGKTQLKMKEVRTAVDDAYRTITERIDALVIVNGKENYAGFIKELNQRVEKFNKLLAQREGRNAKKEEEEVEVD
ncbi:MAG: hypothetical protein JXR61_09440 [Prolixibacteraceae bacterium]|nr:hypothetical protein [Prolixibacteraceae bacterium]